MGSVKSKNLQPHKKNQSRSEVSGVFGKVSSFLYWMRKTPCRRSVRCKCFWRVAEWDDELDTGPQIIYSKSMQILGSWSGS